MTCRGVRRATALRARGGRRQPSADTALSLRGQQAVDRGAAHREQLLPHPRLESQVAVALQRFHQQRQQGRQALLAAEPVAGLP